MAERNSGCLSVLLMLPSALVWAFRQTAWHRSFPRPQKLHTAKEAMDIVDELTSEHGGAGVALPYAQRALEFEPENVRANEFMVSYYMIGNNYLEALPYAEFVVQSRPNSVYACMPKGQIYRGLGRLEDAAAEFRAALLLAPDAPGLWIMLGETLSALGRHAEAADAYTRRLALTDVYLGPTGYANDPEAALAYGRELYRLDQKEAAREVWQGVAALQRLSQKTRTEAGRLLTLRGNK